MRKHLLSILLVLTLFIAAVPAAFAEDPVIATAGDQSFTTLAQAFNDAPDGSTITLVSNVTLGTDGIATVPEGKTLTLDLSTYTISVTEDFVGRPVVNNGTLTVKGEGAIDATASENGYGAIDNYGTLTIENGTYKGNAKSDASVLKVREGATATINGGTFSDARRAIDSSGTVTINAGDFSAARMAVNNDEKGNMTIHGGTFYTQSCNQSEYGFAYCIISSGTLHITDANVTGVQGGLAINNGYAVVDGGTYQTVGCEHDNGTPGVYSFYALYVAGERGKVEAHINGGSYTAIYRDAVLVGNDNTGGDGGINAKATAYITGGTFKGGPQGKALNAGTNTGNPHITGGTFSTDVSAYVAPGSIQKDNVVRALTAEDPETLAEVDGVYYDDLGEALAAAADNKTVTLQKDITLSASVSAAGTSVLDLNGHTIQAGDAMTGSMILVGEDVSLEITGTSGAIKGNAQTTAAVETTSGSVTVSGGSVENTLPDQSDKAKGIGIKSNKGTVTVTGGSVLGTCGIDSTDGTVNVTGGAVKSTVTAGAYDYAIKAKGGSVSISGNAVVDGGEISSAIKASGTQVNISDNASLNGETGIDIFNYNATNAADDPSSTVTMTGGTITCEYFGINGNNTKSAGTTVTITGGTVASRTNDVVIYWPMEGTLTVGGTAKISGGTGIEARMGTINIQDQAVIESTGEYVDEKPQAAGAFAEGSALLATTQMYGGSAGQCRENPSLTVNITGGTLKSANGNAVTVYNDKTTEDQTASVSVTGCTLQADNGVAIRSYTNSGDAARPEIAGNDLKAITGTTTVTVSNAVVAAATDANGETLYYNNLSDALSAADEATAQAPVEVFAVANSDVSAKALSNTNVTLTVAKGVTLNVNNQDPNTNTLKATTNADGSTSYSLVEKTPDTTVEKPTVTLTADKTSATEGDTITLTAKATHTNDKVKEYSYAWYKDGVLIPGATGSTLAVTTAGKYTVGVRAMLADANDSSIVYLSDERLPAALALTFTPRPGPVDEHPEIGEAIANGTWGQPDSAPAVSSTAPSTAPAAGSTSVSVPQTSDDANLTLWIVLLAVSAAAIVVLGFVIYRRRKSSK